MAETLPSERTHASRAEAEGGKCSTSFFESILPINAELDRVDAVPAGSSYGEGTANLWYSRDPTNLPELCAVTVRVASSLSSSYRFALFLPPAPSNSSSSSSGDEAVEEEGKWNGRFLAAGNGGFAGGINWLEMGVGARYGFASLSTDTGHNSTGTDLRWALGKPESRTDWGWRAVHGSVVLGKRLVEAYYGPSSSSSSSSSSPPASSYLSSTTGSDPSNSVIKYSYYTGCSTGGRQGLKELQISPGSFDGVLVGAPAWYTSRLNIWGTQVAQWNWPADKPGHIPWTALAPLERAIVAQCDGADGVEDGIVSAPSACVIDYASLTCSSNSTSSSSDQEPPTTSDGACLSPAQIETLQKVYGDWFSPTTGELLQPGLMPGSEAEMSQVLNYSEASPYAIGYARYFVLDEPEFAAGDFNDSLAELAAQFDPGQATADQYDLSAFRDRGGKIVMYHGMADALVPTRGSEMYYNRTVEAMGGNVTGTQSFFRYFGVPGMQHCAGTVVDAPWAFGASYQGNVFGDDAYSVPGHVDASHDVLLALMDWVEHERPVDSVVATTWESPTNASSGVLRQRPLCPWPSAAVWDGVGDLDQASSWSCGDSRDNSATSESPSESTSESAAAQMWNPFSTAIGMLWLLFIGRVMLSK